MAVNHGGEIEMVLLCPLMAHGCTILLESSHSTPWIYQKWQKLMGSEEGGGPSLISDDKLQS